MAINARTLPSTPPSDVWAVIENGWLYPLWVVGASRMREVDESWPAVGAKLHHSVGSWPLLLDDETEVIDVTPGLSLTLRARARPTGVAEVTIRLEPVDAGTRVVIEEDAVAGPAHLVPKVARDIPLRWRNIETLRRLAYVAERGADAVRR
ncbi:SRPBCC family protein [Nocardioides mangrovi]|uniref:SRPBCC family protein n=1 Tax=Nocardioides mangrovi TaxID=2874580 RepID=A0ABS7UIA5_9ACTN|nr:SRPBCC family protein [Nocardioides mangrovi]MBZ5740768.1 SRPBCC family protein [Nocardioides mangrovi]